MIANSMGFLFDCRVDCNGDLGIVNSFKMIHSSISKVKTVHITCAVDNVGNIVMPAYNDLCYGFKPMNTMYTTPEDIKRFCSSHKLYFNKFGTFIMIVSGSFDLNESTGEVVNTQNLKFYVPRQVLMNSKLTFDTANNPVPAVVCDRLDVNNGFNCIGVPPLVFSAYYQSFLQQFNLKNIETKNAFLESIVLRGN